MELTLTVPKQVLERYKIGDILSLCNRDVNVQNWIAAQFIIVSIDLDACTFVIRHWT